MLLWHHTPKPNGTQISCMYNGNSFSMYIFYPVWWVQRLTEELHSLTVMCQCWFELVSLSDSQVPHQSLIVIPAGSMQTPQQQLHSAALQQFASNQYKLTAPAPAGPAPWQVLRKQFQYKSNQHHLQVPCSSSACLGQQHNEQVIIFNMFDFINEAQQTVIIHSQTEVCVSHKVSDDSA